MLIARGDDVDRIVGPERGAAGCPSGHHPSAICLPESAICAYGYLPKSSRALTSILWHGNCHLPQPIKVIPQLPGDVERWYTVREAASLCHRAEGTIRNLLSKYELPRRLVRGPGRNPRRIALLSPSTIRTLQRLTLRP